MYLGQSGGVGKELWGASTFNVRSRTDLMSSQGQRTSVQRSWKRAASNKPMESTFQERGRSEYYPGSSSMENHGHRSESCVPGRVGRSPDGRGVGRGQERTRRGMQAALWSRMATKGTRGGGWRAEGSRMCP